MSLKVNVIANYVGQIWRSVIGIAFVPLYLRYLGAEAYGLVGIFSVVQVYLGLLDLGMRPALGREMARFREGARSPQSIRDLLRSAEAFVAILAVLIALSFFAASGWLADHWVRAETLPRAEIMMAFAVMGFVTALRFVENVYIASIVGLQRQVTENLISGFGAGARAIGAALILLFWSPTIEAFFIWQGVVSLLTLPAFAVAVYRILPPGERAARASIASLASVGRFSASVAVVSTLAVLINWADKLVLPRLISLEEFGYYSLAWSVVMVLYMGVAPVTSAIYPRFVQLIAADDKVGLVRTYHLGAQLVSVLVGSGTAVLVFASDALLTAWTNNPHLTEMTVPLLKVLALAQFLHILYFLPYQMQLAHGWTRLAIALNLTAVALLVPVLFTVVPAYGVIGLACAWIVINSCLLMTGTTIMHGRFLRGEQGAWAMQDLALPLVPCFLAAGATRAVLPHSPDRLVSAIVVLCCGAAAFMAAALAAKDLRRIGIDLVRRRLQRFV